VLRVAVASLLCVLALCVPPATAETTLSPPRFSAEALLLLDPDGRVIFEKNADNERAPASLVKLMTLYLACEDIEAGRAGIDEMITVSHHAATVARYRMGLRTNEQVALHVLLEGVAIASANDAATALAERLGGDEPSFVARMNDKARDLALLTGRLIQDYPMSRPLLGGQTFIYRGRVYTRHIPLFTDPGGVQALKTGFTQEAGYNLAVSAWREGRQFLMIVLGARTRALSFLDAKKLLHYGFVEAGLETEIVKPRPGRKSVRTRRATATRP
jgi:D-alanyl-D-alanine carboxypeptidase